ncbi:MAG: type 2 isopentenyl-diphosphate Delta-isomerase [Promethearchaeota archaeon]|jgi:isopentenyl-diphosphate delta-isomerase
MTKTEVNKTPKSNQSKDIKERKIEHLKIPLEYDVQHAKNYFSDIKLLHHPTPEIDFENVDLTMKFFNKEISAPICISAITGGHPVSKEINKILAKAAEEENIIMSVGSQRAGIEDPAHLDSFKITREVAPNIPIIGNIGIGQISDLEFEIMDFQKCIDMVDADVMAIHLNVLHELVQDKGDTSYTLFQNNFRKIRNKYKIPIIAKEVGTGFDKDSVLKLDNLGFDGFDIGGAGGTSFAAIESKRNNFNNQLFTRDPTEVFREWGIPTPVSITYARNISQKLIIATGGLRTGIDIAKSIALGADLGGFAYNFLQSAWKDRKNDSISNTIKEIRTLKNELCSCLWLMNLDKLNKLKANKDKYIILGELYQWLHQ